MATRKAAKRSGTKSTGKAATFAGRKPARPSAVKRPAATSSAPMSDAAIAAKTGRTWAEWITTLDRAGARELSHKDIAVLVHERFGVGSWWSQAVTVGYERLTGRRADLQKAGGFAASGSLTVATSLERLYDAAADPRRHGRWLPAGVVIHKATRPKTMRATAADGGKSISFYFYAKGNGKAQVTVQQEKLATQGAALKLKRAWAESLRHLAALAGVD
jgi:hypothetical protein